MTRMRYFIFAVLLWAVTLGEPSARGDVAGLPDIVARGFDAYVKNGPVAALDVWLAGSARATDDHFQDQAAAEMTTVQGWLGRPISYEMVRTVLLSHSTRRCYAVLLFDKGVRWMSFDCYKSPQGEVITRLNFQADASAVLPGEILSGK